MNAIFSGLALFFLMLTGFIALIYLRIKDGKQSIKISWKTFVNQIMNTNMVSELLLIATMA
jgi:hypothetical protein